MKSKANGNRVAQLNHVRGEGPNWVLIAGSALLSAVSIKIGCMLKHAFDARAQENAKRESKRYAAKRKSRACQLHSNLYHLGQDEDTCYHCRIENSVAGVDIKQPTSPASGDPSLPLVQIRAKGSNKDSEGAIWTCSPDFLELPRKPFHHSNSSDSFCLSESGSDIYSKREVIQKLRHQLKRRDDMITEMQDQIPNLQSSLSIQITESAHLQALADAAKRDLFESVREIQRLRRFIAEHCISEVVSPEKPARHWHSEAPNGIGNEFLDSVDDLHFADPEKLKLDNEKVDMLKREVVELKEVIEGKNFLIQNYKEQKVELCCKVKELQQKISSHVPNIL